MRRTAEETAQATRTAEGKGKGKRLQTEAISRISHTAYLSSPSQPRQRRPATHRTMFVLCLTIFCHPHCKCKSMEISLHILHGFASFSLPSYASVFLLCIHEFSIQHCLPLSTEANFKMIASIPFRARNEHTKQMHVLFIYVIAFFSVVFSKRIGCSSSKCPSDIALHHLS